MLKKKHIDTSQIHYISHDYYGYLAKYTGKKHMGFAWIWLAIIAGWYAIVKFNEDSFRTNGPFSAWLICSIGAILFLALVRYFDKEPMFIVPSRYEISPPRSLEPKYLKNEIYKKAADEYYEQARLNRSVDSTAWYNEFQSLNRIMAEMPEERKQVPKDFTSELTEYKKILEELE